MFDTAPGITIGVGDVFSNSDYTIALRFINSPGCLLLQKCAERIELVALPCDQATAQPADLIYTTRLAYLHWALQRPGGDEILFVGSGGIFTYADRTQAARNLHRELICAIRNQPAAKRADADPTDAVFRAKQLVKRLLGRNERDLHDLLDWTVFN